MSATLDTTPLRTVDHAEPAAGFVKQTLTEKDFQQEDVSRRVNSSKPLVVAKVLLSSESEKKSYAKDLATTIKARHELKPKTLTMAVLNRVARAQDVFVELEKLFKKSSSIPELALVHARFRPYDRQLHEKRLFDENMPDAGRIVIATQAIEAGVDVSAATLFTELAPWPSLVQRFGRCNRAGIISDAEVIWIDTQPKDDKDKVLLPYTNSDLQQSRAFLRDLDNVGPARLAPLQKQFEEAMESPVVHTLRRKDLLDLWDTTPDLAGNDLDVSRFIRDSDDTDVQFYWRDFDDDIPAKPLIAPQRIELCSVSIVRAKDFLGKIKKNKSQFACRWNPLERSWQKVDSDEVRSGMVLLLKPEMGGYLDAIGWTGDPASKPTPIPLEPTAPTNVGYASVLPVKKLTPVTTELAVVTDESMSSDPQSECSKWVSLTDHLRHVAKAAESLRDSKSAWDANIPWPALVTAAWWHDVGKSHPAFQNMLLKDRENAAELATTVWAKSARSSNGI